MHNTPIRSVRRSIFTSILRPPNPRTRLKDSPPLHQIIRLHQQQRLYSAKPPRPTFSYRISASFSAKTHVLDLAENQYFHDGRETYLPCDFDAITALSNKQRAKVRYKSGQDAFFVTNTQDESVAFGVVDGVGGWTESGVDPAEFAHRLCEYMSLEASDYSASKRTTDLHSAIDVPKYLLQQGYELVMEDDTVRAGGSTACIGLATTSGVLHIANLGDSGYAHISPLRLTHLSAAQTHDFNTPYQMSKIPREEARRQQLFGSEHFSETPADSDVYSHPVAHGDVFVFATDGIWDNLSPEDVLRIVSGVMLKVEAWAVDKNGAVGVGSGFTGDVSWNTVTHDGSGKAVDLSTVLATAIVREAKDCSLNTRRDGPFAKEVKRYFPMENWRGGKPDDICAVVGVVTQDGLVESTSIEG